MSGATGIRYDGTSGGWVTSTFSRPRLAALGHLFLHRWAVWRESVHRMGNAELPENRWAWKSYQETVIAQAAAILAFMSYRRTAYGTAKLGARFKFNRVERQAIDLLVEAEMLDVHGRTGREYYTLTQFAHNCFQSWKSELLEDSLEHEIAEIRTVLRNPNNEMRHFAARQVMLAQARILGEEE